MELSQLTLRFKSKNATGKQVVKSAESLRSILQDVSRWKPSALNEKLAEYAFFPLSHIFRDSKGLPVRAVEAALQCLDVLISCGWRDQISPDLGKQLLILLSFLAGGSAVVAKTQDVNEELGTAAFHCLGSLFNVTSNAGLGGEETVEPENIPILGQALTVVLDGFKNGPSIQVRLTASEALDSLLANISDQEALRSFFPGIVSSVTRVVQPGGQSKVAYKLLQHSLQTLEKFLKKTISDQAILGPLCDSKRPKSKQENLGPWAEATSSQVKLALANIISLRYHERPEVRLALFHLCASILQNCKKSLSQSTAMMTETLIVLCSQKNVQDNSQLMETVGRILTDDTDLLETVKSSLHDWILALPRIMQSSDDAPKRKGIDRVLAAFQLISSQYVNSEVLNDAMAFNLRASVATAIQASSSQGMNSVPEGSLEVARLLQSSNLADIVSEFCPILLNETSQKDTLIGLQTLAQQLHVLLMSNKLTRGIVENMRTVSGNEQLASLWLSIQLVKHKNTRNHDVEDHFLGFQDDYDNVDNWLLDGIYSFSLDILSKSAFEDESSWKLQALALEVVALQAHRQQEDFRPELVDALYPILERMGSKNAALQHHAMSCLKLVSNACAYPSPSALITNNADYLVNAVALKLNTFDISPQAPQVLVMMVKLCGPTLIPFLDDLVESIFTILACFHGYPRLVESLFTVLHAIVEESAKSPLLAIAGPTSAPTNCKSVYRPTDISTLHARLRKIDIPFPDPDSTPAHPSVVPEKETQTDSSDEPPSPPPTKLLNSIALLTQNHLTSSSSPLLLSLLSLLNDAFPPLSAYPDNLLPLLATLFPLLIARLHDGSPQICTAAAETLSAACRAGGDFLSSRFEDEWEALNKLYWKREREMKSEEKATGWRGGMRKRAWESVRGLVIAIIQWVGIRGEMEDGVFEILGSQLASEGVREVLESLNPDQLWLLEERANRKNGVQALLVKPEVEGFILRDLEI